MVPGSITEQRFTLHLLPKPTSSSSKVLFGAIAGDDLATEKVLFPRHLVAQTSTLHLNHPQFLPLVIRRTRNSLLLIIELVIVIELGAYLDTD